MPKVPKMPKIERRKPNQENTKEEGESLFFLQSKIGNQKSKILNSPCSCPDHPLTELRAYR
jgi:hypothetical protein